MSTPNLMLRGVSSMATRLLLAEMAAAWRGGAAVAFESIGGLDAARRVSAGEPFDLVVLADDAIEALAAAGRTVAGGRRDLANSLVAVAVRAGAARPDVASEDALRRAVLAARSVGFSTGPSGVAIQRLFERWGLAEAMRGRLVQAPPGVPVGGLVARGDVELGFQQLSELMHLPGIDVLGTMPPGATIATTFSAARCTASRQPEVVDALLDYLCSPAADAAKRRHGMEPA